MPSVTSNGQCFMIDGRRQWFCAAGLDYARVPAPLWRDRLATVKMLGFNAVMTACPWCVHEPRRGRYEFSDGADVREFIKQCAGHGLKVILRAGPFVGGGYDGGGMPPWLIEHAGHDLRTAGEKFLEPAMRYLRKLLAQVVDLQATRGGPIVLVTVEEAWTCSHAEQSQAYLQELVRFLRESGVDVPMLTRNQLWTDVPGAIETWRGWDHLLLELRQFREVQPPPDSPIVAHIGPAARSLCWGDDASGPGARAAGDDDAALMWRAAEALAAGAQVVIDPVIAGTNFGFLGGRMPGRADGFLTTSAGQGAAVSESGRVSGSAKLLRRLMTFAREFGHVFAEVDAEQQTVMLDPDGGGGRGASHSAAITSVRGPQGSVVFVFNRAGEKKSVGAPISLLLQGGMRLVVEPGEQPVGWYLLGADLHGAGKLDYANVCPWAIVNRSILVLFGVEGAPGLVSIDGTPLHVMVPEGGAKAQPAVMSHRALTIVVCNEAQIDLTHTTESAVYVGCDGVNAEGLVQPAAGVPKAWKISAQATMTQAVPVGQDGARGGAGGQRAARGKAAGAAGRAAIKPGDWTAVSQEPHAAGTSARFALLEGPSSLDACGAPTGYGWYRVAWRSSAGKRVMIHLPGSADRIHVFSNGKRAGIVGHGPGTTTGPINVTAVGGENTLTFLADNMGRFSAGNDLADRKGVWGEVFQVKPMGGVKGRIVQARAVDPFQARGFLEHRTFGQWSDERQAMWVINHSRGTPVLVQVDQATASGVFVLNDRPLAYFAGASGQCSMRLLLDPAKMKFMRRGRNELRFAPDARQDRAVEQMIKAARFFECAHSLGEEGAWSFAKWEVPATSQFKAPDVAGASGGARSLRGMPCWWRSVTDVPATWTGRPAWLGVHGLSKGQAFVNSQNIGRYFTATADGKAVGPQSHLYVPECWLKPGEPNEIVLFDEHGFNPARVRLIASEEELAVG